MASAATRLTQVWGPGGTWLQLPLDSLKSVDEEEAWDELDDEDLLDLERGTAGGVVGASSGLSITPMAAAALASRSSSVTAAKGALSRNLL